MQEFRCSKTGTLTYAISEHSKIRLGSLASCCQLFKRNEESVENLEFSSKALFILLQDRWGFPL